MTNEAGWTTLDSDKIPAMWNMLEIASNKPQTDCGFTDASYGDSTQLVFLRARWYNPADGRFQSRDTWRGNNKIPMSYNVWLYVYANPINLTDPSGHDPWWCENQNNPELCYAKWSLEHSGLTSGVLKAYYDWSPNEALELLQSHFNIVLPPGMFFRFARYGVGGMKLENTIAEGFTPLFWTQRNANKAIDDFVDEGDRCQIVNTNIPDTLVRFDNSVYIFDRAFTNYDFYPDDVASIMIHEGVHAWQENIATAQQLVNQNDSADDFLRQYQNGLERQAYEIELALNGSRLKLSAQRVETAKSRKDNDYGTAEK